MQGSKKGTGSRILRNAGFLFKSLKVHRQEKSLFRPGTQVSPKQCFGSDPYPVCLWAYRTRIYMQDPDPAPDAQRSIKK